MAITYKFDSERNQIVEKEIAIITGTIDWSAVTSYVENGETIDPDNPTTPTINDKFETVNLVIFEVTDENYRLKYDISNNKVKVYIFQHENGFVEATGEDLTTVFSSGTKFVAFGRRF